MPSAKIDSPFKDACWSDGSKSPAGAGRVMGSFPGLESESPSSVGVNVVIFEHSNVEAPTGGPADGKTEDGSKGSVNY